MLALWAKMINVKAIQVYKRGLAGERGYFIVDMDDEEAFVDIRDRAFAGEATTADVGVVASIVVSNRTKDVFLCARDAKGPKLKALEAFASATSVAAEASIASMAGVKESFLTATFFDEQVVGDDHEQEAGDDVSLRSAASGGSMTRVKACAMKGNELKVIKIEFFR